MLFKTLTVLILLSISMFSRLSYGAPYTLSPHGYAIDYIQGEGMLNA